MAELPVNQLLTVDQAIAIIDGTPVHPRIDRVSLHEAAGRRLAGDIVADRDDPPFDKSLMDGYAVSPGDATTLRVIGDIPAGKCAERGIEAGEAMSIMTGAPLPTGADAVVPVEQTSRDGDFVILKVIPKRGQSIARRGSDCAAGVVVLRHSMVLGPAQVAVAASVGAANVDVFAKPRVAVLSTGDEIVPIDQRPGPSQIRNSNSAMLRVLLERLGCDVADLGIVADQPDLMRNRIERALAEHDVLFVTGGMSMGEYDYVPKLLAEIGVELRISKLRIKPGKPFVFGVRTEEAPHVPGGLRGAKFVFGLPGNPVSGYVCTLRLASGLLSRMSGGEPKTEILNLTLRKALPFNGPREFYQPGICDETGGIEPLNWKSSADIYTLALANALIIREENAPAAAAGAAVRAIRMP
jgi:molybdopterin molybdotransferase